MAVSTPALREAFADVVGSEHLIDTPAALDAHAVDGVRPRWVARPGSAEEVGRMLALAHAERLAVSPRGSGSALSLGNPPRRIDLIVGTSRLCALTEYVPEDMVASVEAGMSLGALGRALAGPGQMLALDPPGSSSRSIGGVLATNATGPMRFFRPATAGAFGAVAALARLAGLEADGLRAAWGALLSGLMQGTGLVVPPG